MEEECSGAREAGLGGKTEVKLGEAWDILEDG